MIVGNGLIAQAFKEFESLNVKDYVICCAGVSSIGETDPYAFSRERDLLRKISLQFSKIVYFGSCAIFDDMLAENQYVKHKLSMEKFIENNFESFIILRLPTVIGNDGNKRQLFPFFKELLVNNKNINVETFSCRYLIDVMDIPIIINKLIKLGKIQRENAIMEKNISIERMANIMKLLLKSNSKISLKSKGNCSNMPVNMELRKLLNIDYDYNMSILLHYCRRG
jgi:nucleoside-diphosphate-sugar epimerase